jgi:phosphate transport system substrate-binding protein
VNTTTRRLALAVVSFAGCRVHDETTSDTTSAATTPERTVGTDGGTETTMAEMELAAGEVFVTGSSTVEPISVLVGELADEMSGGNLAVTVEGPGTGDGFKKFCAGEADISDASRPIKDEEAQTCADAGIEFVEIEVAIDGLTVATSPNNTDVTCLDYPAIYSLVGPESEGFGNWSDAQALATELGSTVTFPDADLVITGPGPESGTYDTFVEFDQGHRRGS